MSLAIVHSRSLVGIHAPEVTVEVHLANGLPSFTLVGLADTEVKEARERVRSAIINSGFEFPNNKRITVNLAPADLPKVSLKQLFKNIKKNLRIKKINENFLNPRQQNNYILTPCFDIAHSEDSV